MVVNKKLADKVLDISKDIYYAKFHIEKMRLIDDYNASDYNSMIYNNKSDFCYFFTNYDRKIQNDYCIIYNKEYFI